MNKLSKLFWHIISTAICVSFRNECNAVDINYISMKRDCCVTKTELVYWWNILLSPNDDTWHNYCSYPSKYDADYEPSIQKPTEPINWNTYEMLVIDGNFFAEIYNNHHYLNSCIERTTNKTLYNDGSSNFIDQCNLNKLFIHKCPYNGIVKNPITIIRGKESNTEHFICTTANLTHNATGGTLKLYRQFSICSACDGINNNTPSITSCYQPATTENTLYENRYGYFTLESDCHAK